MLSELIITREDRYASNKLFLSLSVGHGLSRAPLTPRPPAEELEVSVKLHKKILDNADDVIHGTCAARSV
jgi:hypothetical protein